MATTLVTKEYLQILSDRIKDLYLSDKIPWVVGYSGGKDSTSVLQLVWNALKELSEEERKHKPVYVISTDTLVEQPTVAAWVNRSLDRMNEQADIQGLPIKAHRLTPLIENSFWVQLIGKGYPAPRNGFRWCTSRLKIDPSNRFIMNVVKTNGEAILVLGTRKAESVSRAANMNHYEKMRVRQWLSPNGSLPNSWVFSPIEDWTSDDVWAYLNQVKNPWGAHNKQLMAMYREASSDNECPLVVDNTTPTCGNSRFGCWVCTLVSEDKSMAAMIQNDAEKVWMTPLLDFRNEIASVEKGRISDFKYRDYRRMNGSIKLYKSAEDENSDKPLETIPGPYLKERREDLLRGLLRAQKEIEETAPEDMGNVELITLEELQTIRKIWVQKKSEFEDSLPRIYEEELGRPYPDNSKLTVQFGQEEWAMLREVVDQEEPDNPDNYVYMDLMASLLNVEQNASRLTNVRKGVVQQLEGHFRRCFYENRDDAANFKLSQMKMRKGDTDAIPDEFDTLEDGEIES